MTDHDEAVSTHEADGTSVAATDASGRQQRTLAGRLADRLRRLGLAPAAAIVIYLLLTLTGATTSSMGIASLRADPAHPIGTQIGTARAVRSDEWLTITPIDLGRLASGSGRADTPLANAMDMVYQVPNGSPGESVMFFDGDLFKLGKVVPQSMLFAAWWWLPTLLLVLALPPWLTRLGSSRNMAWLATGLIVFAPSVAWWSLFPIRVLGFAIAGGYLLIRAVDSWTTGRRKSAAVFAAIAGVLLARLPTFYVPWSITIGVPVVLATLAWLLWPQSTRRSTAIVIAGAGALAVGLFGLVALENHAAISAAVNTVYPGQRRSTGQALDAAQRFGAPLFGLFARGAPGPASMNLSELSSPFTVTAVWALVVWIGTKRRGWDRNRAAAAVLGLATAGWLMWCTVPWGPVGRHLPVVNRVPAARASQTVGFLAVLVLALVLSRTVGVVRTRVAMAAAVACGLTTLYGAHSLRRLLPRLDWTYIVVIVLIVAVLVFLISRYRERRLPALVCVALAAAQVVTVNPLIVGFGDLRSSSAARFVRAASKSAPSGYWATDSMMTDALLIANGLPMLSGHQVSGPIRAEWRRLDPAGQFEKAWNRGTSYVEFRWGMNTTPIISSPGFDQIVVRVDPCVLRGLGFPMAGIVTLRPITQSVCLTPVGRFSWSGHPAYAYHLSTG